MDVFEHDWRARAACLGMDTSLFFPRKGGSNAEAKRACAGCPVRLQCLGYAVMAKERWGVWGGETEHGRRRYQNSQPSPAAAA